MSSNGGEDTPMLVGANGLPIVSQERQAEQKTKAAGILSIFMVVPRIVGFAAAYGVNMVSRSEMSAKQIEVLASQNLGYLYFAVVAFTALTHWLNVFPMAFKEQLCIKGNLRANMMFYKVNQPDGDKPMPYVVLEEDGVVGMYNRANRSLQHFQENNSGVMLCMCCAGFVWPAATFAITVLFALGRVAHQVGYATGGYGSHGAGFAVAFLATQTLEGLVLLAGLATLGVVH